MRPAAGRPADPGASVASGRQVTAGLASVAASASGILVGSAIVSTRFVIVQTGPPSLALLRYTIGFCCLLPPVLMAARVRFAPRDLVPIALLGIIQFGILLWALGHTTPTRVTVFLALSPVTAAGLGAWLLAEEVSALLLLALACVVLGLWLAHRPGPAPAEPRPTRPEGAG
jgi:drug/metabolite transporter (DMT)-like permease